jgi:hypothetical protein
MRHRAFLARPRYAFDDLNSRSGFSVFKALTLLARDETRFGLRVAADSLGPSGDHGVCIDPPKGRAFTLSAGDTLITHAEDET